MEMNKHEEIDRIIEAWKQATDSSVIKASTKDWEGYPSHVQAIIEAEAKNRGLWGKVLYLRGETANEPISTEGNLKGYICEACSGTDMNVATGRCMKCELPSDTMGYCRECDKFWSILPGQVCPDHGIILVQHKTAMTMLRIGNSIFDMVISYVIVLILVFLFMILLIISGLAKPDSFKNINSLEDWLITISLCCFYYFIFETIWQRTPGKFITGTKVVTSTGGKPSVGTIAIRSLIRFFPFNGLSFLTKRVYGWHDRWSGTYVIKAKRFEKNKIDHNHAEICPQPSSIIDTPEFSVQNISVLPRKIEVCENCGRTIGKLEQVYEFNKHIVCQQCDEKLKRQP
jgi:uncharacterized RDD family membrane protein YckC